MPVYRPPPLNKIYKKIITKEIVENTNEISISAAADVWRPLDDSEMKTRDQVREERNRANIQSYTNPMEILSSLFKDNAV
jgi:hypothetical protein